MTTLILIRHGYVEGISPERFRGLTELHLTEIGLKQASATRDRIVESWKLEAIYSSPLVRCLKTGQIIGEPMGLRPVVISELRDIDYGDWQGRLFAEVEAQWPDLMRTWRTAPQKARIPGAETLEAVHKRVTRWLESILVTTKDRTVAIIGHDSVNRVLLLHVLGLPLERYWHLRQSPCCINVIECNENGFYLEAVNETFHLRGLE